MLRGHRIHRAASASGNPLALLHRFLRRAWLVGGLWCGMMGSAAEPNREGFLRSDAVWELHLQLPDEAWRALQPPEPPRRPPQDGGEPGEPGKRRGPGSGPHRFGGPPPGGPPGGPGFRPPPGGPPPAGLDFPWVQGRVEIAGTLLTNVGIRFKGNSSYFDSRGSMKRPFKLDFDRHVPGRTFAGLEELFLNNNAHDPSHLRETLAYLAFTKAGVPAPQTTAIRVWLTLGEGKPRQYLGLYTGVEPIEGDFLQHHFGARKGLLVKPERIRGLPYLGQDWSQYTNRYETKSASRDRDIRRFQKALSELDTPDPERFAEAATRWVDVEGLLRFVAVNAWLANYDSFLGNGHNYYLHQAADGRLRFVPWDLNEAFGRHPGAGPSGDQAALSLLHPFAEPNPFLSRVLSHPDWARRYRSILEDLRSSKGACSTESLLEDLATIGRAREEAIAAEPATEPRRGPFDNAPVSEWIRMRSRLGGEELAGTRTAPAPRLGGPPRFGPPPGSPRPPQP